MAGMIALAAAPPASAQESGRPRRIALIQMAGPVDALSASGGLPTWRAFSEELRRRGYEEGRNLAVERRTAEGFAERWPEVVQGVVSLKPDLVVANTFAIADEFKHTAPSIPIVAHVLDPLEYGLVTSLARPEANVTGVTSDVGPVILGKQLDLLITAAPGIKKVAVLSARRAHAMEALAAAAASAGVTVREIPMSGTRPEDYQDAFQAMRRDGAEGLILVAGVQHGFNGRLIAALSARHGLPLVTSHRFFTEVGGLISYGVDPSELGRRLAYQVARLLDGAKPADLPFEQPSTFVLVLNLKTARRLGLTIPPTLLARADEVIE